MKIRTLGVAILALDLAVGAAAIAAAAPTPPLPPIRSVPIAPSAPSPLEPPAPPTPPVVERAEIGREAAQARAEAMQARAEARRARAEAMRAAAEARREAMEATRDIPQIVAASLDRTRADMARDCAQRGVVMPKTADFGTLATCSENQADIVRASLTRARRALSSAYGLSDAERANALQGIDRALSEIDHRR
ncbi:hypothetical protein [Sphingomonas montanisoli]|uniref:Uncharacterized protein n=1 Tax=Sphingomonas montanisoli TaxID=2606412 RepID=A0A5D9CED8_9SPHN|nr:hypothetical protein [Sphingomonas montanisoli]TZG29350.1 hypothetical protein FYJ91_04300 [Sphingomonas montanisoli]